MIKETLIASLIYGGSTESVAVATKPTAVRCSVAVGIAAGLVVLDKHVEKRDRKFVRIMVSGVAIAIVAGHLSRRR